MGPSPHRSGTPAGRFNCRSIITRTIFGVLFIGLIGDASPIALWDCENNAARRSSAAWADDVSDLLQTASDRRLYRILTGRSEKSRSNLVARLALSREEAHRDIEVIVAATRTLLEQRGEALSEQRPAKKQTPTPESFVTLIQTIAADASPSVLPLIQEALAHEDHLISMAAMDAVGQYGLTDALDELTQQMKRHEFDERYAYRFALVRAIAKLHDPEAVAWLERLHRQLDGQLHHEIANRLAKVDIRDFGGVSDDLEKWKQQRSLSQTIDQVSLDVPPADDDSMSLQAVSSSSKQRPKLTRSQYYGIDLNAARMLFIIDRSGSMREPAHYGTRLQRAKRELIQTINGLDPSTEFGVMVFETTIQFFQNEILVASDENKREATAFIDRVMLGQKTNTYEALVEATNFDDQLEAVFMLTDGRPTFGKIVRPDRIIKEIVQRNRTRHLKFHTIGIGQLGETVVFLKTLAEETGGEFRQVP